MRIISASQVRELLPMPVCVDAVARAMRAASTGSAQVPPRQFYPLPDGVGTYGLMPGASSELDCFGAKMISLLPDNPRQGRPAIQGFVALFDRPTGDVAALIEGAMLTGLRTAAASGVATRALAREDAVTCGIFGTGVQAETHIDAMRAVRNIERVLIWGRDQSRATEFARTQSERCDFDVVVATAEQAAASDIICTVTGSPVPVVAGRWVSAGTHINTVGAHTLDSREVDSELVAAAALYVDSLVSNRNEGGDIMIPIAEGAIEESAIVGEIGQVLNGSIPGRRDEQQITLYNSLGITAQDLYSADYVFREAVRQGVGTEVDLS